MNESHWDRRLGFWSRCLALAISLSLTAGCGAQKKASTPSAKDSSPTGNHEEMLRRNPLYRQAVQGQVTDYRNATDQFLKRVKSKHTGIELQELALRILESHPGKTEALELSDDQIPTDVKNLDPPLSPRVTVFSNSHVRIDGVEDGDIGEW